MSKEELSSLASYLRAARERTGLSQRKVAQKAGIDNSYLARLESGEVATRPDPEYLQRICDALGIDSADVMSFIGVKPSLPEPRAYFRRKLGVSADDAEILARLVEEYRTRQTKEGDDEETNETSDRDNA